MSTRDVADIKERVRQDIATGLTIPHINTSGQLKFKDHRFMENLNPGPTASAIQPEAGIVKR